jgi:DNA-binding transcriptional LysR family regulator
MARIDLDSDLLRCFVAVADARGFTAAGDLIGLTQSGISVRIRNLEERLGRRLFDRTSRSVSLTEDGEVLLSYARRMVDLNDEAIGRLTGGHS